MSDIEERLRASVRLRAYDGDAMERGVCAAQMREAADEIERLRDRVFAVAGERDEAQARVEDYHRSLVAQSALLHTTSNERDDLRALLTAVAQSGVSWTTRDYVVAQIDKATWDAVQKIGGGA